MILIINDYIIVISSDGLPPSTILNSLALCHFSLIESMTRSDRMLLGAPGLTRNKDGTRASCHRY